MKRNRNQVSVIMREGEVQQLYTLSQEAERSLSDYCARVLRKHLKEETNDDRSNDNDKRKS
jgi:hypothetical protein